eukprot:365445-Chlamydomonas_euryale.AAC.3
MPDVFQGWDKIIWLKGSPFPSTLLCYKNLIMQFRHAGLSNTYSQDLNMISTLSWFFRTRKLVGNTPGMLSNTIAVCVFAVS